MSAHQGVQAARPRRGADRGRDPRSGYVKVGDMVELNQPIVEIETAKAAVEIPASGPGRSPSSSPRARRWRSDADHRGRHRPGGRSAPMSTRQPSAASLAAVEIAPDEGAVEPGLIGGPAPGGRTAVLVGYGPRTAAAKRRPRKGDERRRARWPPDRAGSRRRRPPVPVASGRTGRAGGGCGSGVALAKPPVRKLARDLGVDLGTVDRLRAAGSITREDVEAAARPRPPSRSRRRVAPGRRRPRTRPRAAHPDQGRPQAHRRGDGGQRLHRAARHRVPDRGHDPDDEAAATGSATAGVARRAGLAAAARGKALLLAVAGTRWSTRPGTSRPRRSWSRSTSTWASPRPPRAA